jgi:hypothetical protein
MKLQDIKQDLKSIDKDHLLGLLGLETKRSDSGRLLTALGTFGVGVLVGAGVALLLAPKAGNELRQELRTRFRPGSKGDDANGAEPVDVGEATRGRV